MRIADPQVEAMRGKDLSPVIKSLFPGYERDGSVFCPFHEDKKRPSLHINPEGKAHCFGCGYSASNIFKLASDVLEVPYADARTTVYGIVFNTIPDSRVRSCVDHLNAETRTGVVAREYISGFRGVTEEVRVAFKLGLEPSSNRITIPVPDQFGYWRNIRRMAWLPSHKHKVLNVDDHGTARLFPADKIRLERKILLVEGEWDALVGRSYGIPAATWTNGAESFVVAEAHLLEGKHIFLRYDNDAPGKRGMEHVISQADTVGYTVEVVEPPHGGGKDLCEWGQTRPEWVYELAERIAKSKPPVPKKGKVCLCPTCGQAWDGRRRT